MAHELLFELHQRGIKLRLTEGRLDVLAPPSSLTPQLREQLKLRRDELIALMQQSQTEGGEQRQDIVPAPQDRYKPFPLTDIQHAYWVGRSAAVELGGVSCHWYEELESDGLDVDRLNSSLRRTIARHDMLRAIVQPDGQQRILPEVPDYTIAVHDLRGLAPQAQEAEITRLRGEMSHQVLPADTWPLFAFQACRLEDRRLRLYVSLDLLILDGLSLELFFADWRRFYEEPDWNPEPLALSYRDYVLAEQAARDDTRDDTRYARAEKYWSQRLTELPPAPALPLAKQPGQLPRATFTRRRATVPRERWVAVKQNARQRGLTPSAVLMTAFADVLALWSKQPGFTLNLTLFNRPEGHPEIGQVIGDFTSVTLLDATSQPDESFTVRAERLHQQLMRDLTHSAYSGVRVMRERARRLGAGPAAAMPVVFTSALMVAGGQEHASSMRFFGEQVYGLSQTPQVWLDHQVLEDRGSLVFNWDCPEGLFPDGLVDDMFAGYQRLLDLLADDPDAWDAKEQLVGLPQWQRELRARVNDTTSDIPVRTLPGLVADAAARHPDAVAVIAGNGQLTYQELMARADRLAHVLAARDARQDPLVGIVLEKGWEQPAAALGVTRAGAAYLPIDPGWPAARRHHLLRQGGVRTVVTTARLRDELSWPDGVRTLTFDDPAVRDAPAGPPPVDPAPEDLAYVIFTSGSTGQPKGVMIDHRGAANTIQDINHRFRIGPGDRVLALSALTFDLSVYDVFGILAAGGTMVLPIPGHLHDPAHWTDLVRQHRVTIWNSVPALMQAWVDSATSSSSAPGAEASASASASASTLRAALLSGDWIPVTLPNAVRALHPDVELLSLGGATEASIWSVSYPIGEVPPEWTRIPYGKPLANQSLHIYDERLEPCPVWTVGEIYIGGVGVAKGYWADPEKTADRFVIHPRSGERLYRTGDLGRYLPDGDIEFLGREDAQVKLNGYRIELGEITAALRRQPGVGEALVTISANPRTERRQLVAHIVPATSTARAEAEPLAEPPAGADGAELGLAWPELIEAGESELRRCVTELAPALASYSAMWRTIEGISPPVMARTLARLEFFRDAGDTATLDEIITGGGISTMYRGLVRHWLRTLEAEGLLRPTGQPEEYRCERGFDADALDQRIRRDLDTIDTDGVDRVVADYFIACTEQQVGMLRGEVNPVRLLLPDGDGRVTEALYATNPVNRLQNRTAARLARTLVDQVTADRPVRILEAGAGTGATTTQILPALPADRVSYRFTDISTFFTTRAKRAFGDYDFVEYGLFDIDDDPVAHGLAPGSFDLVIAANVLHDAKDLTRTLRNLRGVLAPGGVLMLIEGTVNSPLHMLSVAFLEGYANFQDQRELPLLSAPEWGEYLTEAGFARFTPVPADGAATDVMVQHVLLAQAPGGTTRLDPVVLRGALNGLLPDYMVPHHYLFIDEVPLSANGKVDTSALPSPWDDLSEGEQAAPRDDTERKLFEIWSETLGRNDFGVDDNFFELGGDSLHAVHILGRMRDELGMRETPEEGLQILFDAPTIGELSRILHEQPAR